MRTILHCDINNCFASIEAAIHPELRGHAIAVCGDPAQRRGIVLAKSEEAKKFGVKTGDPLWKAKQKCPEIWFVKPHFSVYEEYSRNIRAYYLQWTPLVEPFGLDECWLDVSGCPCLRAESGVALAHRIRQDIHRIFGVTVSVGVSFNKVFAKLGSDMRKPDAVTVITPDAFRRLVWPLPVSDLLYVGRSTEMRLRRLGILCIGDLARSPQELLRTQLGKNGVMLWRSANGFDEEPVRPESGVRQSLGHGTTLPADIATIGEVWPVLCKLSEQIAQTLLCEHLEAGGIQVYVRFPDLSFQQFQRRPEGGVRSSRRIAEYALMMISQADVMRFGVRAVGIRLFDLHGTEEPRQLSLFSQDMERRENRQIRTDMAVGEIRSRFGAGAIRCGIHEPPAEWCHPPGGRR